MGVPKLLREVGGYGAGEGRLPEPLACWGPPRHTAEHPLLEGEKLQHLSSNSSKKSSRKVVVRWALPSQKGEPQGPWVGPLPLTASSGASASLLEISLHLYLP